MTKSWKNISLAASHRCPAGKDGPIIVFRPVHEQPYDRKLAMLPAIKMEKAFMNSVALKDCFSHNHLASAKSANGTTTPELITWG